MRDSRRWVGGRVTLTPIIPSSRNYSTPFHIRTFQLLLQDLLSFDLWDVQRQLRDVLVESIASEVWRDDMLDRA